MLNRANALLGANWTLHDLRHTAAYRMDRDPELVLTDVQWVLGHAHLTATQIYVPAGRDEIVEAVQAHHQRQERLARVPTVPAAGYRALSLSDLFGGSW
ncbi:tyrosine-type recombinase/integrase [Streptomyces violaceusniger]|uniref:tyrosine-type recombinase/integrase n=1 Tax=Streptomyces violaceusniger TaxID=68280 RepID=UPI0009970341|nr:tyrosine-type recombinase/integrase [Streptomyces hygroscopicus]AQW56518.1 integrase [Streptomyces hygroscopicus]